MSFFNAERIALTTAGRWLQRPTREGALRGVSIDSREDLTQKAFIAIKGHRFDGHDFVHAAANTGAAIVIVERSDCADGVPAGVGVLLVDDSRKAMGELALAYRRTLKNTAVVGVAGSAGKTTTKVLIDAALAGSMRGTISPKSFNNDIGVPLTILSAKPGDQYLIVEIGTNHQGEIAPLAAMVEPDIAVITMIGREHLEGLGSLENIAQENAALLDHLRPGGVAIVNADSPLLRKHLDAVESVILFGESPDADLRLTDRGENGQWWFEANSSARFGLSLPGRHNAINALAAVAVGRRLRVPDEQISHGLAHAQGPPMRMARQQAGSVTIYNDAYNANPDSMLAALETFAEVAAGASRRVVVLGDMLELGAAGAQLHREIGNHVLKIDARARIDMAIFIGELSAFAAAEVARKWSGDRLMTFDKLDDDASIEIAAMIRPGDAVLIKASRGVALERIVHAIENRFPAQVPTGSTDGRIVSMESPAARSPAIPTKAVAKT